MKRLLTFLVAGIIAAAAHAHDPLLSGIGIIVSSGTTTITVQADTKRLGPGNLEKLIEGRLNLVLNDTVYKPVGATLAVDKDRGIVMWRTTCPVSVTHLKVLCRLFPEDPSSRTILTITRGGQNLSETILDANNPVATFGEVQSESPLRVINQFLKIGVMHIFTGPDHILFILGLILVAGSLRSLIKTVSSFTLAHSITLTIAALGIWVPATKIIEPLIALSIVIVAFENLRQRKSDKDYRPLIAFAFGLIHGFGFAGGLTDAGLSSAALGWSLVAFNIGVEIAQLSIVLSVYPLLMALSIRRPLLSRRLILAGSLGISAAGAFWFADRCGILQTNQLALTSKVSQDN